MQGFSDDVSSVACHPSRPLLSLTCYNGSLQVWDYELKLLMNLREFNYASRGKKAKNIDKNILRPQCIAFDPTEGSYLAVGFTSGSIKFLRVDTLENLAIFNPTKDPILAVTFSSVGDFLAAYDSKHRVMIFAKAEMSEDPESREGWASYIFLGRSVSHGAPITGLQFGFREGVEVLVSVGEDRKCVEYDLKKSSVSNGIICVDSPVRLELSARPTAMAWHPRLGDDIEDRFFVANDEFKIKEFNAESKQCRKTTLAPVFGGPPNRLIPLLGDGKHAYYAYSTEKKVVGLGCLPLGGNPTKVMGLVAHPDIVSGMAISYDGKFMFTAGGADLSANMWSIDIGGPVIGPHPDSIEPFIDMLEGGAGGDLHNDLVDYFYYCQLRTQGEDAMESRSIKGRIPLDELPNMMRAIGFYPTEEEIGNMVNEVRYRHFMIDGEVETDIGLEDFIRLYLNHRPVLPLDSAQIDGSFAAIADRMKNETTSLSWADVRNLLVSEGEAFSEAELDSCLSALIGKADIGDSSSIDAAQFATNVLGFEDVGA